MSIRGWLRDHGLDWRDAGMVVWLVALGLALIAWSVWFVHGCAASHGAHWWCWLG